jgi:CspA family cold shock protein
VVVDIGEVGLANEVALVGRLGEPPCRLRVVGRHPGPAFVDEPQHYLGSGFALVQRLGEPTLAEMMASAKTQNEWSLVVAGINREIEIIGTSSSPSNGETTRLVCRDTDQSGETHQIVYTATGFFKGAQMANGIVKFYNSGKGYGFIAPDGGGGDVFVHVTVLERAGLGPLSEGQAVEFETAVDRRSGKTAVSTIKLA